MLLLRSKSPCLRHSRLFTPHRNITMAHAPIWLRQILTDTSAPLKLYAWTPKNLNLEYAIQPKLPDDSNRRIYIIGVGNLGRMFASYLSQVKPDAPPITLVVHKKQLLSQWIEDKGIEITRKGILYQNKNFDIEYWTEESPPDGPVREVSRLQNVLVSTKATAAVPEVDRIRGYLDSSSTVAFAQNGMSKLWPPYGPAYMLHRYPQSGGFNTLLCVTNHGVLSEGAFKSLHASPANISIGSIAVNQDLQNAETPYLAEQLLKAPYIDGELVLTTDLWILQLEKLVVNACINPLTAILRQKNGYLFEKPDGIIAQVLLLILSESSSILQALVQHSSSLEIMTASLPPSLSETEKQTRIVELQKSLTERFSQSNLRNMVYTVGDKVKANTSSMLQDARAGKPTEIRDFNGWLVDMAAFLNSSIKTEANQKLIELVESQTVLDEDGLKGIFTS